MATPNWDAIRPRWEAGEDLTALAAAFKVQATTLKRKAADEKWDKSKRPRTVPKPPARTRKAATAPKSVAERSPAQTGVYEADAELDELEAASAQAQHLTDWQLLRNVAVRHIKGIAIEDPRMVTAVANALKAVQVGQRLSLGLDVKATEATETDKPGGVIRYSAKRTPPPDEHDDRT